MNELRQIETAQIGNAYWPFFGAFCQQNPNAFLSLNRLLNAHNFDTIIEIGTHTAGLSMFFALYALQSCNPSQSDNPNEPTLFVNNSQHRIPKKFYTFDNIVRDKTAIRIVKHLGGIFEQRDALFDQNSIEYIKGLIKNGGSVLLLCDGGNKKKELELYGSALKTGDFVMLHDWAYDNAAFELNKRAGVWFSHETMWEDGVEEDRKFGIKDLCEKYNIQPIYREEFDKVAWVCGVKT